MRVLFATNMYPLPDRPSYGIFVKRQADALRTLGYDLDEWFINGSSNAATRMRKSRTASRVSGLATRLRRKVGRRSRSG